MNILFLVAEFPKLSETFILHQISWLRKKGHRLLICALGNPREEKKHPEAERILPNVLYPPRWAKKFLKGFYFAWKVRDQEIDLIHAHFGFAGQVGRVIRKLLGAPLVTSFYGIDTSPVRFAPKYYQSLFKEGDLFLVLSEEMKKDLLRLGCPEDKIRIHHVGVNLDIIKSAKPNSKFKTILSVGRLVEKKGFEDLLQAFRKVKLSGVRYQLKIIGGGPLEENLKKLAEKFGLGSQVKFLGPQPYEVVLAELTKADVFALASYETSTGDKEGTPVVLMDAQAAGVPVVSTRHAGIPEVVLDGKTGVLVEERDVEGLSLALLNILKDPELGWRLGEEGRRHIERNYNIKRQVEKLEEIYYELKG